MTRKPCYVLAEGWLVRSESSSGASGSSIRTTGRLFRKRCRPRLPRLAEDRNLGSVRYALADVKNRLANVRYARGYAKNTLAENKYARGKVKNGLVRVICYLV